MRARSHKGEAVNKHAKPRKNSGRKTARVALTVLLALCLVGIGALAAWHFLAPKADAGATVTSYDGMTDEEIQAELDRQVEASRMTISVAAKLQLKDGRVRVNVVNAQDSRFGQLFTLEQDGKVLYKSGVVDPGKTVEWVDAKDAHTGEATITVSAADCLCQAGDEQSGTRNLSSLADGLVKRSPFRASAPRPCGGLAPRTR